MSFLRRDKSKNNIFNSFAAGQYNMSTNNPNNRETNEMNSNKFQEPPSPMTDNFEGSAMNTTTNQTGANSSAIGSENGANTRPKLDKKLSSNGVYPTSSSSSMSSNDRNEGQIFFNSKFSEHDDRIVLQGHHSQVQGNQAQGSQEQGNQVQQQQKMPVRNSSVRFNNEAMYSPRSSIVSLSTPPTQSNNNSELAVSSEQSHIKDNYKGFHANKRPKGLANIPPLAHPIKPRFRKKGSSLLGKLIYSSRKDSEGSQQSGELAPQHSIEVEPEMPEERDQQRRNSSGNNGGQTQVNKKSVSSAGSNSSKHKFRIPSISLDHHHHHHSHNDEPEETNQQPRAHSTSSAEIRYNNKGGDKKMPTSFDLDMDINEMQGIVKSPNQSSTHENKNPLSDIDAARSFTFNLTDTNSKVPLQQTSDNVNLLMQRSSSSVASSVPSGNVNTRQNVNRSGGGWRAPDSWDVKLNGPLGSAKGDNRSLSDSDNEDKMDDRISSADTSSTLSNSMNQLNDKPTNKLQNAQQVSPRKQNKKSDVRAETPKNSRSNLPVLYGSSNISHVVPTQSDSKSLTKGPNHIVRVFKEDNTFTTILCPLETTTAELLNIVQRKFFLESTTNYQISVYIGNCVKVLEPFERPLKIQMGLLMLSGYSDNDNLRIIGREDLSYICKFVVENIYLRNLTHEEEIMLSKDYVDVNISNSDLKNIPIIFHQHTYEIEKLNVSDNPSIYIPLDFIQSCTNLTSIIFSRNGCSKFPINFLEAKQLTHLNMEKNFLDDLPSKIGHLRNLTHLKLNSNQLSTLPKSFGKLQNLVSLNLSSNYLEAYPEAISELYNLADLDLSYNDLSYLPESIGKLTQLIKLNVSTNKLSKTLPLYITKLISLKRFDLRYNKLTNVDVLGSLPNLEVVYASKNNISTFNDEMESLRLLHFDRNPITDLTFDTLLPNLAVLDLSKAKITAIPPEFMHKISSIEKLVLDKNHLINLPNEIGNLTKLAYLSAYGNNLQVLPPSIDKLVSLQYLDLHSNNLQLLPNGIWDLKSLTYLNVSSNMLSTLPQPPLSVAKRISSTANFRQSPISGLSLESDSRRPSFQSVIESDSTNTPIEPTDAIAEVSSEGGPYEESSTSSVNFNNSSGSLADSLLVLVLADNRLDDDCFDSISFLVELKTLNLSYNDLLEIPEGAARRMTKLVELYLSGNELTSLPTDDLDNIKSLKLLYLNNNKFVSLPAELSKLVNLQHLDVGSNQLKYNISNWPYDWNWHWNKNLKYLNFSGNKRFEIKQSHMKNPDTGEDFDSLLVLKNLKVLGLIDVTLTTTSVPDHTIDMRIRTTASELDNIGYGVSDTMGMRDHVSSRDIFIQKFRGNENEVLICSIDGKSGSPNHTHRISALVKSLFVPNFTNELNKLKNEEGIQDAIRRTFLSLNKEINGILSAKKYNCFNPSSQISPEFADLNLRDDAAAGCAMSIVYIKEKKLYTANIGDVETLLSMSNGDHILLTNKHDPTNRTEFERIRASGGYVSGDGALDGDLAVSRGVGFFNYLPHTHSGPDISEIELTSADDMIIMATKVLWNYITFEIAVDILRQEKNDPMIAAQKLRDYAICYGATDKIAVIVITLGEKKSNKMKFGTKAFYNNLGQENDVFAKKRRDRSQLLVGDSTLRRLEEEIEPPEGILALAFTDIKNSTLLWDSYPVAMRSAIKIHNAIMRRQLRIVGGYEVKTEGDAFMVSFPSPTAALLWCFNVQQQLLKQDWPAEILETDHCCEVTDSKGEVIFRGLSVRMGIHWGSPVCELDYVTRRMDYFGPMVNRASRIMAIADGGQIAVSSDFLAEIRALYKIHEDVTSGATTLYDAYQGNVRGGEIIEREIRSIEEIKWSFFELGEKKLKGLETPELITLVYPKKLEVRFEIFQKRLFHIEDSQSSTRIVGTLPVYSIYGLRTVSLRLENICSCINGGVHVNEGFQMNSSDLISEKINSSFKESDLMGLLNHIVTRIENCAATLHLRQQMSLLGDKGGYIDFTQIQPISNVMDDLKNLIEQFEQYKMLQEGL